MNCLVSQFLASWVTRMLGQVRMSFGNEMSYGRPLVVGMNGTTGPCVCGWAHIARDWK